MHMNSGTSIAAEVQAFVHMPVPQLNPAPFGPVLTPWFPTVLRLGYR
jgi:hypothetical protein